MSSIGAPSCKLTTLIFTLALIPQLSAKLSDLGERVRHIRPSPSQPNLSNEPNSVAASPVPSLPLTLPSPSLQDSTYSPSSPEFLSPHYLFTERLHPPKPSVLQSKSMETLPSSRTPGAVIDPPRPAPSPSISPARRKPTTRNTLIQRHETGTGPPIVLDSEAPPGGEDLSLTSFREIVSRSSGRKMNSTQPRKRSLADVVAASPRKPASSDYTPSPRTPSQASEANATPPKFSSPVSHFCIIQYLNNPFSSRLLDCD
jgi:hypothetical protein